MRRAAGIVVRGIVAALLAFAAGLVGGQVAEAAQYKVSGCGAGASFQNHLLTASTSDSRMSAYTACPTDSSGHPMGVATFAGIEKGKVPPFSNAMQSFVAPAGTTIRHVRLKADGRTWNGDWTSMLQASNDRFGSSLWNVAGCTGNPGSPNGCTPAVDKLEQNYDFAAATGFRTLVSCANLGGCTTFSTGMWPYTRSFYFIRDFDITLDDAEAPSVAVRGTLASGQWLRGLHGLVYDASDNTGIRRTQVTIDQLGMTTNQVHSCDYTFAVPCQNVSSGGYPFETALLSDGPHQVTVRVFDATDSNVATDQRTVLVDNHAPTEPESVSVVGGEDWRSSDGFTIRWTNPASAAPIEKASYELCRSDGSGCVTGSRFTSGISELTNVRVGQPGDYTIRVWLTDAAGNESAARSAPLHLKFDNVPPAQAAPQHRNGWVDKSHSAHVDQQIDPPVAGVPPVSGIAGYAVTTDGSMPGTTVDTGAGDPPGYVGHRDLENLPEGVTTVRARAISGSRVPSSEVGSADIHVDLTAPTLDVGGVSTPHEWVRGPVELTITSRDPDHLSGVASSPGDRDVSSGGYIEYALDDMAPTQERGPQRDISPDGLIGYAGEASVEVHVGSDGPHTISYRAFDVAGNGAADKSVSFKIDQTPPELAVFEAQQEADPQLITVAASDRTSGLADGGKIQLRRVEPHLGSWITLRTTRQDDRYYGRVENGTLPEGDYQFRATVPDQAGNEATATTDREGHEEVIHITPTQIGPYPTPGFGSGSTPTSGGDPQDSKATVDTVITATAIKKTVSTKKCKGGKRATACPKSCKRPKGRRKKCTRVTQSLVHDLRIGFGKRASTKGRLTTAGGTPIGNAEVIVLARPTMAGGVYAAEATVRTNANGGFAYMAHAGPGRALDFHFRGDDTYKHADDQITLRVPAAVTIKASRHSIRNGKRVRFTGKLKGRPYPVKGKILDLQAYYRHRWRTFATPRAAQTGKWSYKYRFGATRGRVLYKFRIRVRPTSDYPYELGYSKVTKVRVFGR
jgi:hypothetical protein